MTLERIVVLNDISDAKGGATALALLSALDLRNRGLPGSYLTGDSGRNAQLADAGVDLVGLGQQRLKGRMAAAAFVSGLYNRGAAAMIREWIARNDTPGTVYHLHGWAQILSPSVFAALQGVEDRVVLSAHDFFLACPNGSFSYLKTGDVCAHKPLSTGCIGADCDRQNKGHKLWRVARQIVQRRYFDIARPPPVLMIHEGMRPYFTRSGMPDGALHTLPNPITPFAADRIAAETNRRALFVGRLETTKGPDLACAASRAAGVPLTLVGDGELGPQLRELYPEFTFTGRLPPAEIAAHARDARMLLMPSRYPEPYGLVAIEAAWSGLPVIVADTALLAPDIVRCDAGNVVAPRDTAAFAQAIAAIANDDALVERQSHAAFLNARHLGLTTQAWVDGLIDHYNTRLMRH